MPEPYSPARQWAPSRGDASLSYFTPPWVFDRLGLTFDLDVAAPPGGVEWIPAARHYDMADDGLTQSWAGLVWMNPPYSDVAPWWQRFATHRSGIALLPMAKTRWFSQVWRGADALSVCDQGEMYFVRSDNGERARVPFPVVFAAFGDECVVAIGRLGALRKVG